MPSKQLPEIYEDFVALFPNASGNDVNGLGETKVRQPSPFFWHPIDKHDFSKLQTEVIGIQRRSTAKPVPTGPPPTMTTC